MSTLMRFALMTILLCFYAAAKAQDDVKGQDNNVPAGSITFGTGVICDTFDKMQRYLNLYKNEMSPDAAIKTVNAVANSVGTCGAAAVAFKTVNYSGSISFPGGIMRIMQITVVALKTPEGWLTIPPTPQYTAVFEKADEA